MVLLLVLVAILLVSAGKSGSTLEETDLASTFDGVRQQSEAP